MSRDYALITGASGGIGRELANCFAAEGIPLILVARSKDKLEQAKSDLKQSYSVDVQILPLDLAKDESANELYEWTNSKNLKVGYLVNNAGFGDINDLVKADTSKLKNMVRLNMETLVFLSKVYGSDMAKKGSGKIVNIASVAGFVPGPGMAVYYASKAFVINFSQSIAEELRSSGVKVTVVCPGPTKSGFADAAGAAGTNLFKGKMPSSSEVAKFIYKAMKLNKSVAIWSWRYRIAARLISLAPRAAVLKAMYRNHKG